LKNEAFRSAGCFLFPVLIVLGLNRRTFPYILCGVALGYALALLSIFRARPWVRSTDKHENLTHASDMGGKALASLWQFGWAVGIWLLLCQGLPVIGRATIQHYVGDAQAGEYASLYEFAVRAFSLFAFPVTLAAHPRIMRYWNQENFEAARRTLRDSIKYQILMFIPVEILGFLFARPITRLIVGNQEYASNLLFSLLMLGGFLWQIALLVHKPLEIMRRTKTMLCGMLLVLLTEFLGNYLFVPRFGILAAVYVFVLGAVVYLLFISCASRVSEVWAVGQKTSYQAI
jgi:O-antigen/teichoic acid export membrane protein